MKRVLLFVCCCLLLLVIIAVARTMRAGSAQVAVEPATGVAVLPGAAERLAGAVRIPTISHEDSASFDAEAFQSLHAYLEEQFPRVHAQLQREHVASHSVLYTWPGTDTAL